MAVHFITRSSIPVSVKGKVATEPMVTISGKGQMSLNSYATKFLEGKEKVGLGFDKDNGKLVLYIQGAKALGRVPEEELFKLSWGTKRASKNAYMTFTGVLRNPAVFGEHIYDFAASGSQTFKAVADRASQTISFDLPKGSLPPRPKFTKAPRRKREPVVAPAPAAVGAAVPGNDHAAAVVMSVGSPQQGDLVLE